MRFPVSRLAFALLLIVPVAARAELHIDITRGKVEPMPIAIPVFAGADAQMGQQITQVMSADLERSGLFQPIDPKAFIDKQAATRVPPQYGDWRQVNAQALVTGNSETTPAAGFRSSFACGTCSPSSS